MIIPVLWVKDLEASLAFYTEKMGFSVWGDSLLGPDGKAAFSVIRWGEGETWLQRIPERSEAAPNFELHVGLDTDADIHALYEKMQANHVAMYQPLKEEFWGEINFGATDLDGFRWRFGKTVRELSREEMSALSAKGSE